MTCIDPRGLPSLPLVITIFTHVVCPSVPTFFQNLAKQNKAQARIVISTGGTVSLAEWIIEWCVSLLSSDGEHEIFLFLCMKPNRNV